MIAVPIIAGVLTVFGLVIFLSSKFEKKRTEELQQVAEEMGLQFNATAQLRVQEAIGHLRLFNRGHGKKFKNMMFGEANNVELAIFDYRYTTGGGKNKQTHQQTVICFQSSKLSLPAFELRPENFLHKVGQAFGYQDIDFETHPVFSKQFILRGEDEAAIREFFTPLRLQFFESLLGVSVETSPERLIFYRARKRAKPAEIRSLMKDGFSVFGELSRAE